MTPICDKCGIRYEEDSASCPLCGKSPDELQKTDPQTGKALRHFRELVSFSVFSVGLVVFITDIAYTGSLSWSQIPLLSLGYLWITLFLLSFLQGSRCFIIPAATVTTGLFLFFLSGLTSGEGGWFSAVVIPVLFSIAIISVLVTTAIRVFRMSLLGSVSSAFAGAGLLTICIDLTLSPGVSWSLIAASGVVPIIVFLSGLERRLRKKGSSLQKYFNA